MSDSTMPELAAQSPALYAFAGMLIGGFGLTLLVMGVCMVVFAAVYGR